MKVSQVLNDLSGLRKTRLCDYSDLTREIVYAPEPQALVRLSPVQAKPDAAAGTKTACCATGYRETNSLDLQFALAAGVVFPPGHNEYLADRAESSTQLVAVRGEGTKNGVFARSNRLERDVSAGEVSAMIRALGPSTSAANLNVRRTPNFGARRSQNSSTKLPENARSFAVRLCGVAIDLDQVFAVASSDPKSIIKSEAA